jgi:hypothetical protein
MQLVHLVPLFLNVLVIALPILLLYGLWRAAKPKPKDEQGR